MKSIFRDLKARISAQISICEGCFIRTTGREPGIERSRRSVAHYSRPKSTERRQASGALPLWTFS